MNGRGTPVEVARTLDRWQVVRCLTLVRRLKEAGKQGKLFSIFPYTNPTNTLITLEWYLSSMLVKKENDEEEDTDEGLEIASSEDDIPF